MRRTEPAGPAWSFIRGLLSSGNADVGQGPTFLVEYDNTQDGANHVHCVYRDFDNDFGDALMEHYSEESPATVNMLAGERGDNAITTRGRPLLKALPLCASNTPYGKK